MLAYGRPPGRKHRANNERSPAPVLITQPQCFKKSTPNERKEKSKDFKWFVSRLSLTCVFELWGLKWFFFSAPGVEMGHLNKAGKKNKWRSGYFCLEEKEEALNSECQQFKELHWWLGAYMHTHTSICIHVAIQFKETGCLLGLHKAMFMVTVAASHTHI